MNNGSTPSVEKDLRSLPHIDLPKTIYNVAIASAVTAYARVHLYTFIEQLKGELYYVDTDSIVCDKPLDSHLIGNEIGLMKDELNGKAASEGFFISPKLYGLKLPDYSIIKSKGVPKGSLSFEDLRHSNYMKVKHYTFLI